MSAALSSKIAAPAALVARQSGARATRGAVQPMAAKTVSGKTVKGKTVSSKAPASSGLSPGQEYALTLPGITEPFPNCFDPANFLRTAKPSDVKRWRESEIMHSRVAMLAALGFVVGEQLEDFPAFINFDGDIEGPAIYQFQQVEEKRPLFWEILVVAIGLAESYRVSLGWATPTGTGFNNLKDDYNPGSLGFDPLGLLKNKSEEEIFVLQTKELNNGRLAMLAIAGFVLQELVPPHREIFEHLALYVEREVLEEIEVIDKELGLNAAAEALKALEPVIPPEGVAAGKL